MRTLRLAGAVILLALGVPGAGCWAASAVPVQAHRPVAGPALPDPTRPPGKSPAGRGTGVRGVARWVLSSTLISPDRRLATINGRIVAVGQRVVGGAVVEEIQPAQVRLRLRSRRFYVKLLPGSVKWPVH